MMLLSLGVTRVAIAEEVAGVSRVSQVGRLLETAERHELIDWFAKAICMTQT